MRRFMESHQQWLEEILLRGFGRGEFSSIDSPVLLSRMIFNSLQGSLLVKRSTEDLSQLEEVIAAITNLLQTTQD